MKIALFNYSDNDGGAARATQRIHSSLINFRINSTFYVEKKTIFKNSIKLNPRVAKKIFPNFKAKLISKLIRIFSFNFNTYKSIAFIDSKWPEFINNSSIDIVHLNWINAEMMSIEDIAKISKPIVWTFHDMWPFLGSDHLVNFTPTYKNICSYKKNIIEKLINIDQWTYSRKKKWIKPFQIVTPSKWLEKLVKKSDLMCDWPIETIPHPIDTNFWCPLKKKNAKKLLGIDNNKKIILYGADGGTKSANKGFDLLIKSLEKINNKSNNIILCIFGNDDKVDQVTKFPIIDFGVIRNDKKLKLIYNASDVCAVPSRQETFCQVALEAQSCGIPVVAFSIGGLKDIVQHKKTGYLASAFSTNEFSFYLDNCLNKPKKLLKMGLDSRQRVLSLFSMSSVGKRYIKLYKKILKNE
jgi:glycosyltransferase involved in cell wall biosynthesis